jgi:hypothetical protein
MSGQSGTSPVDRILRNVDVAGIQDERARECIRLLLNLVESLTADLRRAESEILYLREQLNRRQGGGGKPDQPKDTAGAKSQSSEKERAERKQPIRRSKLERIRIDREEVLKLDRASLPPDAEFKGYEDVVVQELRVCTDNVKFARRSITPLLRAEPIWRRCPPATAANSARIGRACACCSRICAI